MNMEYTDVLVGFLTGGVIGLTIGVLLGLSTATKESKSTPWTLTKGGK